MEAGVAFSSSGDFAYIEGGHHERRWQIIKNGMESSSKSYRYMQDCLAVDGAFYSVSRLSRYSENSLHLSLTKPEPSVRQGFPEIVWLRNLVHLSSSYAHRCQVFLLLGRTDDEYMQALLIPDNDDAPEIKTIPLTWAKARAILDQKWETAFRRPLQEPDQDSDDEHAAQGKTIENGSL